MKNLLFGLTIIFCLSIISCQKNSKSDQFAGLHGVEFKEITDRKTGVPFGSSQTTKGTVIISISQIQVGSKMVANCCFRQTGIIAQTCIALILAHT